MVGVSLAVGAALVFKPIYDKLITTFIEQRIKQYFATPASIKTDFEPHLKATFDKCTMIKTVLDGTKPLNMLDIYAGQNFEVDEEDITHYNLIDRFKTGGTYVLTGTGGGGKSMFMRYLWISLFIDARDKIPFFLELRSFDKAKHSDLEDFIYQSVLKTGSTISKENFAKGLRAGDFYLLLDGFDEVAHDNRQELQSHIIALRENNPDVTLIISSRPDDRFYGWNQFEIIAVLPLNEEQVRDLIKKAPFDEEKKTVFLNNLGSIYQTHESFLSTPLLAYMMLIAYADNQNLPDHMVDFYEQAFNALYERHDLMKNGYKRKFHCNLGRTDFKKLISLICLASYRHEKYEFTQEELETLIDKTQKPLSLNQTPENVIRDLTESLCFLKKEGLSYDFTHRSFQEYFAAYCLTWHHSKILAYVENFSMRISDNVVLMLYQLEPQLFRKAIIKPIYENDIEFFEKYDHSLEFILNYFNTTIRIIETKSPEDFKYFTGVLFYMLKQHIIFDVPTQMREISNYRRVIVIDEYSFFRNELLIKQTIDSTIDLQNSKLFCTIINLFDSRSDSSSNYVPIRKRIAEYSTIEINYDMDKLMLEFKASILYENIIDNFDKMHQFFIDQYATCLREEASANVFDDF